MPTPEHFNSETLRRLLEQDIDQTTLIVGLCTLTFLLLHFLVDFKDKANNNGTYKWFLANAIFIHVLMDGLVGYFHLIKPY